jgi:hypothetical protein
MARNNNPRPPQTQIRWLACLNNSGQTIPAFAAVRVTDADSTGVLQGIQPTANGQDVYLNGPIPIKAGSVGRVTRDWPWYALYDSGTGTPANGDTWGATANSWKLAKNNAGFTVDGGVDATLGVVLVRGAMGSSTGGGASSNFGCIVALASPITYADNSVTLIHWDTAQYDPNSIADVTTNFDINLGANPGLYICTLNAIWGLVNPPVVSEVYLGINGAVYAGSDNYTNTTDPNQPLYQSVSLIWKAAAGDKLTATRFRMSGTTGSMTLEASSSLRVVKIG